MNQNLPHSATVRFPCETIVLERLNEKKKPAKEGEAVSWVRIGGDAMPLKEHSRNLIEYREKAVRSNHKSLGDVPVTLNHNMDYPFGRTNNASLTQSHVTYQADLMPDVPLNGIPLVEYIERGVLKNVSIQAVVENIEYDEEADLFRVDVVEFVELAVVTVAGFGNTSIQMESGKFVNISEAFDMSGTKQLKKEQAPDTSGEDVADPMEQHMERLVSLEEKVKELDAQAERLTAIEAKVAALEKKEQDDEDDENDDDDEGADDKDKKKNKQSANLPNDQDAPRKSIEAAGGAGPGFGDVKTQTEALEDHFHDMKSKAGWNRFPPKEDGT